MANIHLKPGWNLPERTVTPEAAFHSRRAFIKTMGAGAIGAAGVMVGLEASGRSRADLQAQLAGLKKLNAPRNNAFQAGWPTTDELIAALYNNFYDFSTG